MSRPSMMAGFHTHAHAHPHAGHYGVPAAGHYETMIHSGLPFAHQTRQPMRAPVLAPVGFNHHHHHHQRPLQHGHLRPANNYTSSTMTDAGYVPTDEELAHLQKLSGEYVPEAAGPLVGERQSSTAITTEYANADPIYRRKTAALPNTYAYFRTCRGDGHCGWRAIAFTYFEALLRVGDANRFEEEMARLTSMGNLFEQVGLNYDLWIDFADEAFDLMRKLAQSIRNMDGTAADILLAKFNDYGESMSIITYVKFLTSVWLQTHPDEYVHYVPMGDIKSYCSNNIEPANCEADNVGIAALCAALIKPAGFGLEVWYLDRSPGEEINCSFSVEPTDHNHNPIPNAPMLRLLYRPGHYDILYKAEDVPQTQYQSIANQAPLQVHLANNFDDFIPTAVPTPDLMTMIPGMSGGFSNSMGQRWASLPYDFDPSPAPQVCAAPPQPFPNVRTPAPVVTTSHMDFVVPQPTQYNAPSHHNITLDAPQITLPIHSAPLSPPPTSIERAASIAVERGGPFRPSMYELEPGFGSNLQAQPFQTSIFRNSHYNTAHFMNPDFQPEEWSPDGDYAPGNRARLKSHSS